MNSLRLIRFGVDTLECTFDGSLVEGLHSRLDIAKAAAQVSGNPEPLDVSGCEMFVQGKGAGFYRWLLTDTDRLVRVAPSSASIPPVSARLRASALASFGHEVMYQDLQALCRALGPGVENTLSRIDLAADIQGWRPDELVMRGIVCPATYMAHYVDGRGFTFQYGKGNIVLRIYEKTEEIAKRGKRGYAAVWKSSPLYDSSEPVIRVEAQIRGAALKEFGCRTVGSAFSKLPQLFAACLGWCDLRIPTSDSTKARWPRHPVWTYLAGTVSTGEPCSRVRTESIALGHEQIVRRLIGLVAGYGAATSLEDYWDILKAMSSEGMLLLEKEELDLPSMIEGKRRRQGSGDVGIF